MKLTIFLLLISAVSVLASKTYSQTKTLSLNMDKATVREVLEEIEEQSEFYFMYSEKVIDVKREVSVDINNEKIGTTLNLLFDGTNVDYTIKDRIIVLTTPEVFSEKSKAEFQQNTVSGTVTDESGQPLPGVTVVVKGTTQGTVTNADGDYSLTNVPEDATLQFSFVGMLTQEILVGNRTEIDVTLVMDAIGLEEVVAIGYGTEKKGNLAGSVSSVKAEKLTVAPIVSTANAMGGLLPGLVSKQTSGMPGFDAADISIRGFGGALVIVDGIESSFNNIDPSQIETISILKDGAASIYGARAGNGVILVTTKRGNIQKPTITINSSFTLQGATYMLDPASSGQRSEMEREAWLQAGNPEETAPWTSEQVQKFYDGSDPIYPNTDWYEEVFRDWAPQQKHNMSVRGGSEKIKYYGFFGYTNQETMIKTSGGEYSRYNLQSNIDASITDDLSMQIDISMNIEDRSFPFRGMRTDGYMWQDLWGTLPYYPAKLSDPSKISWGGIDVGGIHVTSNKNISGYDDTKSENYKGTISLDYKFRGINGLSLKALVNYNKSTDFFKAFNKPSTWYTEPSTGIFMEAGSAGSTQLTQGYSKSSILTQQYYLNYDNIIGQIHALSAKLIYESTDYKGEFLSAFRDKFLTAAIDQIFAGSTSGLSNNGYANEMGRKSVIGRINYRFKDKYIMEGIMRADASAKFPKEKQWGYFPSLSLGWVLSEESFLNNSKILDNLKARVSYGESGNDAVGNFQYLSGYNYGATYLLGEGPKQGLTSTGLANPNLTWERMNISNFGVEFSLLKRKVYGEADIFYRQREGIPATRILSLASSFGASLPPENINSLNDRGFELMIGTAGEINDLSYNFSANLSWSRAKWDHFEEPEFTDPDQERLSKRSGEWTDRTFGYQADGVFTSMEEINSLEFEYEQGNQTLRPGDFKYIDTNGDGTLNWMDQVLIGKGSQPHWMMGFNANLKYNNFDFSALFQGAFGYNTYVDLGDMTKQKYELRWTEEENDPNSYVARLGGAGSNGYIKDTHYQNTVYLRLKTASLGYSLPERWLVPVGLEKVRFYLAGTNLLTFSSLSKYNIDPEAPNVGRYYPQQRTISFGVNISL